MELAGYRDMATPTFLLFSPTCQVFRNFTHRDAQSADGSVPVAVPVEGAATNRRRAAELCEARFATRRQPSRGGCGRLLGCSRRRSFRSSCTWPVRVARLGRETRVFSALFHWSLCWPRWRRRDHFMCSSWRNAGLDVWRLRMIICAFGRAWLACKVAVTAARFVARARRSRATPSERHWPCAL